MNATENTENTENPENTERSESIENSGSTESPAESGGTSLYVRRGRTPTLGLWVALALVVPAVVALISAPFFEFADLGGVFTFVLLAVVFVGLPLAAIAAVIDSIRHRTPRRRRR